MRLDQLKYLIHVSEVGSITKSAESLYISQQGLSQAIKQMETELGVTLFHRERNKLTITDAGRETVEKAREILAMYGELLSSLEPYIEPAPDRPLEELEVFSISIICETILPATLSFLQKKYRYIKVKVQETDAQEMPNRISPSSKCMGLFLLPLFEIEPMTPLQESGLIIEEIYRYKLMACVAKSSHLAEKRTMSFAEFIEHPLSMYNLQTRILDHIYNKKFTPNIILNSTNIHLCRETIAKDLAIGFTDELVEKYLENKYIKPIPFEKDLTVACCCMTTAEMLKNPTAMEFLRVLKSKAAV